MKKLILLLITLTTFTNVSYASFSVTETQQTEVIEKVKKNAVELPRNNSRWIYGVLSILFLFLALIFVLMIFFGILSLNISGPVIANYIVSAGILFIAAIVFGIISFLKK